MSHQSSSIHSPASSQSGIVYALMAYGSWGLLPMYWKLFGSVSPVEVLTHRILWSMLLLMGILWIQGRGAEFEKLGHTPKNLLVLLTTGSLLAFNWGLYIYGVNSDRVVETSLGYFINPLVNVLLGFVFLKERLTRSQTIAVALATVGVANFIWHVGIVPWIALSLAFSFGLYGLLRKIVPVSPMMGLAIETLLVTPVALLFVSYLGITGAGHLGSDWRITFLFIGAGIITSMPLLWFNNAAKRLKLSTLGFFQYLAPSIQLLLGIFLYHEPFTRIYAVTFGLIWAALVIYSASSLLQHRSPVSKLS